MNRLAIVLALAVASVSSVACTAASEDEQQDGQKTEEVAQTKEELAINPVGGGGGLTCHRFPDDTCVSVGSYCNRHGGQLWCDLAGNCTCRYSAQRAEVLGSAATDVGATSAVTR